MKTTILTSKTDSELKLQQFMKDVEEKQCLVGDQHRRDMAAVQLSLQRKSEEVEKIQLLLSTSKVAIDESEQRWSVVVTENKERIIQLEKQLEEAYSQIFQLSEREKVLTEQVAAVHQAFLEADEKRRESEFMSTVLTEENNRAKVVNEGYKSRLEQYANICYSST
jgi:hypothetical protein